jgi:hypothetical protein
VHGHRVVALDEVRVVPLAAQETRDLLVAAPAQNGRPGDLVAVEMQNRQHGPVARRIQEVGALPGSLERRRLRFPVAHHGHREQIGIVERGAEGVNQNVAEFAPFMDRPRRRHADVAWHAAGRGELPEQPPHALDVLRDARVDLRVRSFEIDVRHDRRAAVTRSRQIDDVGVRLAHEAIEMDVDEAQPRRRSPVAEQARLDVLRLQRVAQERILLKIDLPDGQIVRGPPVRIEVGERRRA